MAERGGTGLGEVGHGKAAWVRRVAARMGLAWQGSHGLAMQGVAWRVSERRGKAAMAVRAVARLGSSGLGVVRIGKAAGDRTGKAWPLGAWLGSQGTARPVQDRHGQAASDCRGTVRQAQDWQGLDRSGRAAEEWLGQDRVGTAGLGVARQPRHRKARRGAVWEGSQGIAS